MGSCFCFAKRFDARLLHCRPLHLKKDLTLDDVPAPALPPEKIGVTIPLVMQFAQGHFVSMSLYTVCLLDVPTVLGLKGRALTTSEIVSEVASRATGSKPEVHAQALERIMRLLSQVGVFAESVGPRFGLTDVSQLLRTDAPQPSLRSGVLHWCEPPFWRSCMQVPHIVSQQGRQVLAADNCPWTSANGLPPFPYYQAHPESMNPFSEFMDFVCQPEIPSTVEWPGWAQLPPGTRVCDVGGNLGDVARAVKEAYPDLNVMNFDLEEATKLAPANQGVKNIAGDFFREESIPQCDVIYMKHILHEWNDVQCQQILRNCSAALPEDGGQIIIVDVVLPEAGEPNPALKGAFFLDIVMLNIGSMERSEDKWRTLLNQAGFAIASITPSPAPNCYIIEALRK